MLVKKTVTLLIRLSGTNHILGHKLRYKISQEAYQEISISYLIVGEGGISGFECSRTIGKDNITIDIKDMGFISENTQIYVP
jgi:hypothetical protein